MQQAPEQTAQPIGGGQEAPEKKSKLWLWIIIGIIVLVILGLGYYFLLA